MIWRGLVIISICLSTIVISTLLPPKGRTVYEQDALGFTDSTSHDFTMISSL